MKKPRVKQGKAAGAPASAKHRPSAKELANLKPPWQPGQSGNPAGREKGSRNKLQEAFLTDFLELWALHGRSALERVAKNNPVDFVRAAVAILPKQIEVDEEHSLYIIADRPMSVEEWAAEYAIDDSQARLAPPGGATNGAGHL